MQTGFFDFEERFDQLNDGGDPLVKLDSVIDWEIFRPKLQKIRLKDRKSTAGRKPYDAILMFKIVILQSLYNLSDDQTEFQIRDRLSFMRFLHLDLGSKVPDAKTIWLFKEQLTEAKLSKSLFDQFDKYLRKNGFAARKGQIIDASIVQAPKQRNSRDNNQKIKEGETPDDWSEEKKRQKDTDARWTQKNGKTFFGYKNHINVDNAHKLIRDYDVTAASVHDSNVFEDLLDERNSSRDVWADSAYYSEEKLDHLDQNGFRQNIQRKGCRNKKLTDREKIGNRTRSKTRSRVEHVFGHQCQRAGNLILRSIGIARAKMKIGLRNLTYNMDRYRYLVLR